MRQLKSLKCLQQLYIISLCMLGCPGRANIRSLRRMTLMQNCAMTVILHRPPQTPSAPFRHKLGCPHFGNNSTGKWCVRCTNVCSRLPPHTYILQANPQKARPFTHQCMEPTSSISPFSELTNSRCHLSSRGPCITTSCRRTSARSKSSLI